MNDVSANASGGDLPPIGSPERIALDKALSALDTMAEIWSAEIDLRGMAMKLSHGGKHLADAFMKLAKQSFVEGAYRHHLAVLDGQCPHYGDEAAARIRELTDKIESLKDAGRELVKECEDREGMRQMVEHLKAQVARDAKDAERYRQVRRHGKRYTDYNAQGDNALLQGRELDNDIDEDLARDDPTRFALAAQPSTPAEDGKL